MAILVLLNNFLHDFSAAGWLFGSVFLWTILRPGVPVGPEGRPVVDILSRGLWLMRLSFAGIVIFGVVRALAYRQYEWNTAAGDAQITLLIVKHVVLTGLFIVGCVYYRRAAKIVGSRKDD